MISDKTRSTVTFTGPNHLQAMTAPPPNLLQHPILPPRCYHASSRVLTSCSTASQVLPLNPDCNPETEASAISKMHCRTCDSPTESPPVISLKQLKILTPAHDLGPPRLFSCLSTQPHWSPFLLPEHVIPFPTSGLLLLLFPLPGLLCPCSLCGALLNSDVLAQMPPPLRGQSLQAYLKQPALDYSFYLTVFLHSTN